jgi:hypothetical protein
MRRSCHFIEPLSGLAATLLVCAPAWSGVETTAVTLSPLLTKRMHDQYGDREIPALQRLVTDAVRKQMGSGACGKAVRIQIEIEDATPTHPTRWQMDNDPSLDFLYSKSIGGAELTGRLLGPDGQALATVAYRRFAPDIYRTSMAADPWADAQVTVDQFASKLIGACRAQEGPRGPA